MFKYKGLGIAINCNMRIVNYVKLTMDPTVLTKSLTKKQIIYM